MNHNFIRILLIVKTGCLRAFAFLVPVALMTLFVLPVEYTLGQDRGGYVGSFVRVGLGARARAMGGAFVGFASDIYSGYYNPAGLPDLETREVTFSYRNLALDREFLYTGFAAKLPPSAGLMIGWLHAGVNNIDGRDSAGNHTQSISNNQNAFLIAFGLQVSEKINIGVGGTLLRESFPELSGIDANGFGLNVGILTKPVRNLSIGASIRDVKARYSWNSESLYERGSSTTDLFPVVYTVGAGWFYERISTTLVLDVFKNSKSDTGYHVGFENSNIDRFTIRGGINNGDLTAGFGIVFPFVKSTGYLNYAFEMIDNDPETSQILTFSVAF